MYVCFDGFVAYVVSVAGALVVALVVDVVVFLVGVWVVLCLHVV